MIGAADADESDDAEDADADIEAAIVTPSTGSSTHVEPSSLRWSFFRVFNHNRHHWDPLQSNMEHPCLNRFQCHG